VCAFEGLFWREEEKRSWQRGAKENRRAEQAKQSTDESGLGGCSISKWKLGGNGPKHEGRCGQSPCACRSSCKNSASPLISNLLAENPETPLCLLANYSRT
jgi:hypothetical protein